MILLIVHCPLDCNNKLLPQLCRVFFVRCQLESCMVFLIVSLFSVTILIESLELLKYFPCGMLSCHQSGFPYFSFLSCSFSIISLNVQR